MMHETTLFKVVIVWTILSFSLNIVEALDKSDCGKTQSCYSKPGGCLSSEDCEYLLKYSVSNESVVFEMSSNKYEWIAVGFNFIRNSMGGGESLSCERYGDSIILHHYDMPNETRPDPSNNSQATLLDSQILTNYIYCKFQRKLHLQAMIKSNLNNPFYFLYAAGDMAKNGKTIKFHSFYETSLNKTNIFGITDNTDRTNASKLIDIGECKESLGCARTPSGCHDNTNCRFLVTFERVNSSLEFSISGKADGYISVGFNKKPKMGGTDAVICQIQGKNVVLKVANLEYDSPEMMSSPDISLLDGRYEGGIIYCKFRRPFKPSSKKRLSLNAPKYIIYGQGSGRTTLNKHTDENRGCSMKKVDFRNSYMMYQFGGCDDGTLEIVHGSFMIFAWLFLVLNSMFIARYSRHLWKNWEIFGSAAWFQLHRLSMVAAVVMTVIAIIIIFLNKQGWSESAGAHGPIGIIVTVFAIIQPTVAIFRPHVNHKRRYLFNWVHRTLAIILFVLVMVQLYEGGELLEDSGGDVSSKVLIATIVIAIITALIFEYLSLRLRAKNVLDVNVISWDDEDEVKSDVSDVFWETKAQRILLLVISLTTFVLSVTMIAFIASGGSEDEDDD
ncbi:ferric-chelate reductase 1-like [Xenia sp. Carnegie-2017]|uniref:ferric-chelate reductase 1-like n=1 Tax=Xenia sp. Carnegie-2017 TaxID=2897299 RepID=UPI001F03E64D|nr:ferric-chelate reductase 1-like [Xenia sp. Carnegie-2017]